MFVGAEMSHRRIVLAPKCPGAKMSWRRVVLAPKCPDTEMAAPNCPGAKYSGAKLAVPKCPVPKKMILEENDVLFSNFLLPKYIHNLLR